MKKLLSVIVSVLIIGLLLTDFSYAEVNDDNITTPIYQPFEIIFAPDKNNPDPLRDGLPWAEYDPVGGYTFFKVETIDGKEPEYASGDFCRLALDKNNLPIRLDPSDENYTTEIRRCMNVLYPNSYVKGDLDQKVVSLLVFFEPIQIYEGELFGVGRSYPKDKAYLDTSILYVTKSGELQIKTWRYCIS
ncbi:MAG: hypothetical protein R2883_00465 [Caldisericia bacterium]